MGRSMMGCAWWLVCLAVVTVFAAAVRAQVTPERGDPAWLAYRAVKPAALFGTNSRIPATIVVLGKDALEHSAVRELVLGWRGMLNRVPRVVESSRPGAAIPAEDIVVLGTQTQVCAWRPELSAGAAIGPDAYRLHRGDTLTLTGMPEGGEPAPFDYIEVTPAEDSAIHRTP